MKKLMILFFTIFVLSILISNVSIFASETIKIGVLCPFTGPGALMGQEGYTGIKIATDMVNEKGGLWGKKIELVKGDAVDPKIAISECERLITVEKVDLIIGTFSSSLAFAATPVADRHKIFYLEAASMANNINERGFKYLFRVNTNSRLSAISAVYFVRDVVIPKLDLTPETVKIALLFEDSEAGTSTGDAIKKECEKYGYNIVLYEHYNRGTIDLSPLIMKLKVAEPDILIALQYIDDGTLYWRQAKDLDFNVKAFIGTGGIHAMSTWAETFPKLSDYAFVIGPGLEYDVSGLTSEVQAAREEYIKRYREEYHEVVDIHSALGFSAGYFLYNYIMPKAGSTDADALREAALKLDIPEGGSIFGYGVKFAPPGHPEAGQNLRAHRMAKQWMSGNRVVVWPEELALKEPVLPMPEWDER